MHGRTTSSPRLPRSVSSRPVSPFNPSPSPSQPASTTHSRAQSLQPQMSRRPSFPALHRDEDSCLIPVEADAQSAADEKRAGKRKLSLSLNGVGQQDSTIKIDWSGTGSTFVPLGGGGGREKEESKGGYLQLAMDEISPIDLSAFKIQRNRRLGGRVLIAGLALVLITMLAVGKHHNPEVLEQAKAKRLGPKNPLKSKIPLHSFRANLKENSGYVTSFPYGGLTNQLIELFKLVHLGQLLDRSAILTELKATHGEGEDVPLSTYFDLPSFSYYTNASMVEWRDVKIPDIPGTADEQLSCWGWRNEDPLKRYNVRTAFWPPPGQLTVPSSIETSMTFPAIEVLVSQNWDGWLKETAERYFGSVAAAPAFPDKKLLCFENLFYVPSTRFVHGTVDNTYSIEELAPEDPVWSEVGRHLKFTPHVNHIADELLQALLGRSASRPFIGVHLRQGDFVEFGRIEGGGASSLVERYSAAVDQIQKDLVQQKRTKKAKSSYGAKPSGKAVPVLFTTDSADPALLRKLSNMGWLYVNHGEFATQARFGGWMPAVLDSAILSRASGFVGTKQSTFSYVTARRVETWNEGVSVIV